MRTKLYFYNNKFIRFQDCILINVQHFSRNVTTCDFFFFHSQCGPLLLKRGNEQSTNLHFNIRPSSTRLGA